MTDRPALCPPAAAQHDPAHGLLAIELSRASWIVASLSPISDKISLHKLQPGDVTALLELIARQRTRISAALGRPVEMVCCYEWDWDWDCPDLVDSLGAWFLPRRIVCH